VSATHPRTATEADVYQANSYARAASARWRCEAAWHPDCPTHRPNLNPGQDRYEIHHVHQRRHGGPDDYDNLRFVCRACHALIHRMPTAAEARGLLLPKARHLRPTRARSILYERDDHGTVACYDLGCDCTGCAEANQQRPRTPLTRTQLAARRALIDTSLDPF
jgi:hypothetical protein